MFLLCFIFFFSVVALLNARFYRSRAGQLPSSLGSNRYVEQPRKQ